MLKRLKVICKDGQRVRLIVKVIDVIQVRLVNSNQEFVANVFVLNFLTPPDVILWGERYFMFQSSEPAIYKECFVTVSFTTPEEAAALSN